MRRRSDQRLQNVTAIVLLALSFVLMLLPSKCVQPARGALLAVAGPVEMSLSSCFDAVASLPYRLRGSDRLLDKCRSLSAENTELESKVTFYEAQILDRDKLIAQLRDLKSVVPGKGFELIPAAIVGKDAIRTVSEGAQNFTIGIGSAGDVRRDDLVVVGYAGVGKVESVTTYAAHVRSVTDADFRIAARTVPDGVESVLRGAPGGRCQLTYVDARSPVKVGDFVVTSGFENVHPPGLLLGTVEKVTRSRNSRLGDVLVKPATNFDRLSQVIVVRRKQAD